MTISNPDRTKHKKVTLWYSPQQAKKGKVFFVPVKDGEELEECTGITLDQEPPSESSQFVSLAYLPVE